MELDEARQEKADKILDLMTNHRHSLRQATKAVGIGAATFMDWVRFNPELAKRYATARDALVDTIADELLEIADKPFDGETVKIVEDKDGTRREMTRADMYNHRRLQIDTRKFLLARLAPHKYGDRLELAGDQNNPLTIEKIERVIVNGNDSKD